MRLRIAIVFFVFFFGIQNVEPMVFMIQKEDKKSPDSLPPQTQKTTPPRSENDFYSLNPDDMRKIEEYVRAIPGIEDQRITTALHKLEKDLPETSQQDCSQGVRKAIMAERGIDIFRDANAREISTVNGREAATSYGLDRMLKRNGYNLISSDPHYNTPKRGDVQTIYYGKTINGYGGHVQYYDGNQWISDHKQETSAADPTSLRAVGVEPDKVIVWTYRRQT